VGASGPEPPEPQTRWPTIGLTALAGLAAFAFIGTHSLWMDEALTAWAVRVEFATFTDIVGGHSANLGLYYLLVRAWSAIGTSEATLRAFSALWAIATIPVFLALARRLTGRRIALIAGALLAIHPFLITLAQEARVYTLVAFLAAASTLAFVRAIEVPSARRWAVYTVFTVVGVYAHAYAGLIPVTHAASLAFLQRDRIPWRHLLASAAGGTLLLAPLAVASAGQAGDLVDWIPALGRSWIYETARQFADARIARAPAWLRVGQLALYLGAGGLGALALIREARTGNGDSLARWRSWLVLLWAGLPILLVVAVSFVKPLLVARYLVGSLPAIVLVAAAGIASLRPAAGRAAVALLLVASASVLAFFYTGPSSEDWRSATRYLATQTGPGDRVYAAIEFGLPDVSLPSVGLDYYADRVDPPLEARTATGEDLMPQPERLAPGLPDRIWVVASGMTRPSFRNALAAALGAAGYEAAEIRQFGGLVSTITVVRFQR
jgi:mannosyltransferase